MNLEEHINYWLVSSEEDWLSAVEIAAKNQRRHFSLFIGHLSVEKLLKAAYVKIFNTVPPYKHDLVLIAEKCNFSMDDETRIDLKIINEFNIQARYPDYKYSFYEKCTADFVDFEIKRIGKVRQWIKDIIENTQ